MSHLPFTYDEGQDNDAIECQICFCPLIDPVEHSSQDSPCSQTFCRECVETLSKCPFCICMVSKWESVQLTPTTHKFLFRPLAELKVTCNVCHKSAKRKDIVDHVESCEIELPKGLIPKVKQSDSPISTHASSSSSTSVSYSDDPNFANIKYTINPSPIQSASAQLISTTSTTPTSSFPPQVIPNGNGNGNGIAAANSSPNLNGMVNPNAPAPFQPYIPQVGYQPPQLNGGGGSMSNLNNPNNNNSNVPPPIFPQAPLQQGGHPFSPYQFPPRPSSFLYSNGQPVPPVAGGPVPPLPANGNPKPVHQFGGHYPYFQHHFPHHQHHQQMQQQMQQQQQQQIPTAPTSSVYPSKPTIGRLPKEEKSSIPIDFKHNYIAAKPPKDKEKLFSKNFGDAVFTNDVYTNSDFTSCRFKGAQFNSVQFDHCTFTACEFANAMFTNCTFIHCRLVNCDFKTSIHSKTHFIDSAITNGNFSSFSCPASIFAHCRLSNVNMSRSTMTGSLVKFCKFVNVNMSHSSLLHTNFPSTRFINVSVADCEVSKHSLATLKKQSGVRTENLRML
ncbi:hypothetical protein SAMD00019534_104040 [Acytostelium subglobosum LB1]|uniref:hypothetical protein n=1 Tax=Acytostelium subglobosum LB1 TaxID=1410327 RepID=UPI000644C3B4|nr:hypothetical protein SAMD00019534_104040 [Acytostelium subglobosum LB1]GAM27229.1 hypothetical protein SAMD00019534_104040 [Acytostelium subglobosum LB1]|eukprot:XP_012749696.1 hypothetical protein SAMD00019534_104040 [Acytostelium subglobosum LB1]